jgi:hypothetical protein
MLFAAKMFYKYLQTINKTIYNINYIELIIKTTIVLSVILTLTPEIVLLARHFPVLFSICLIVFIRDSYF